MLGPTEYLPLSSENATPEVKERSHAMAMKKAKRMSQESSKRSPKDYADLKQDFKNVVKIELQERQYNRASLLAKSLRKHPKPDSAVHDEFPPVPQFAEMGTNAEFTKEDDIYQSIGTNSYDLTGTMYSAPDQMLPQITARI